MENQKLVSINEYQSKEYILGQIKDMQLAILKNDFYEVMQICDWIGRECEEILED
jgi:hypothetical protein